MGQVGSRKRRDRRRREWPDGRQGGVESEDKGGGLRGSDSAWGHVSYRAGGGARWPAAARKPDSPRTSSDDGLTSPVLRLCNRKSASRSTGRAESSQLDAALGVLATVADRLR